MIETYTKLFESVKSGQTILAGCVEDSRGVRFCEIFGDVLGKLGMGLAPELKLQLDKTKDSNLLTHALQHGERTAVFSYSSSVGEHPILSKFGEMGSKIFSFYIKTAEFDRPIRVDFLADGNVVEIADKISSAMLALAGNSAYGIPSVIVEADQRAKLSENDLDMFYSDLMNKVGNIPSLFLQRRNQRPFTS